MVECPNCHEDGEFYADNPYTSVFWCRNDACRVSSFDNVQVEEAKRIVEND